MSKIIFLTKNQLGFLSNNIDIVIQSGMADISDIAVCDMGSTDGTLEYLCGRGIDYVAGTIEEDGFGVMINTALNEFSKDEDFLLLGADCIIMPEDYLRAKKYIDINRDVLAYTFEREFARETEPSESKEEENPVQTLYLKWYAAFFVSEKFKELGGFDDNLKLPHNVCADISFRAITKDIRCEEFCGLKVYKYEPEINEAEDLIHDRGVLKPKWGMNYFNVGSNDVLLSLIVDRDREEAINFLEIGCDCGGNLLGVKKMFKNASLYGVEINENSARISSHLADVVCGNIEEQNLDFGETKMDYIMFGDVLEHLRDPLQTIIYCKSLLKEGGAVIASIPNLAHFTVIKELLNGRFEYSDTGLLDRTHIHFFTGIEIIKMFEEADYEVKELRSMYIPQTLSEADEMFVKKLLAMGRADESNLRTYQYHVLAKKR
ncbi:MAG: methyltransferase domain-containing protein [Lachnospiraceae bacterium]|nr:methyltransferase domain-containing protein [Lachnospiraceae bacterium]